MKSLDTFISINTTDKGGIQSSPIAFVSINAEALERSDVVHTQRSWMTIVVASSALINVITYNTITLIKTPRISFKRLIISYAFDKQLKT